MFQLLFNFCLCLLVLRCEFLELKGAMAVDDNARRDYLAQHVSSDLQYIWQEADVALSTQYDLAQHYKTVKVFSSMCDTKAELREALRTDFRLDPAANAGVRADVAQVITAWEMSKRWQTKRRTCRLKQRFWVCQGFFSIQNVKLWSRQLRQSWESYKTMRYRLTNTSPSKWKSANKMSQLPWALMKSRQGLTPPRQAFKHRLMLQAMFV